MYGQADLPKELGSVEYQVYAGRRSEYGTEGLAMNLAQYGIRLGECSGPVAGADLRWKAPSPGVLIGASYGKIDLAAPDTRIGPIPRPLLATNRLTQGYAQWERGKLLTSTEFRVIAVADARPASPDLPSLAQLQHHGQLSAHQ